MHSNHLATLRAFALCCAALAPATAFACATCGCSLSSDAAMGYGASAGWRVSLQYDYIDQNQLRSGTSAVSPSQVATINDAGGNQEVEQQTINRYWTLGLAYSPNANWNFSLLVPYIDRSHTTYGAATNPLSPQDVSGATVSGIGDVKFLAAWQGLLPTHALGFQLGVKLPTGNYGGPNAAGTGTVGRDPTAFSTGPNSQQASPGNLLDTSLQAGNGSTDLIVGAYYYQAVSQNFDAFANGQFQASVMHRLDQPGQDYRPGNQENVSFGLRYEKNPNWVPQLQVNLTHKSADQGALADTKDTAGTVAYISPGLSVMLARGVVAYGFVQLPAYSNLQGYQLFPHWTASVGLSYSF
jgi:hypothetical protein